MVAKCTPRRIYGFLSALKKTKTCVTRDQHINQSLSKCHCATCWRGLVIISFQCLVSNGPLLLLKIILPIISFRPTLSKSITITSIAASRILSQGISKKKDSLYTGFRVRILMEVFFFSTRLFPNLSHILTYGSTKRKKT